MDTFSLEMEDLLKEKLELKRKIELLVDEYNKHKQKLADATDDFNRRNDIYDLLLKYRCNSCHEYFFKSELPIFQVSPFKKDSFGKRIAAVVAHDPSRCPQFNPYRALFVCKSCDDKKYCDDDEKPHNCKECEDHTHDYDETWGGGQLFHCCTICGHKWWE